MNLWLKRGRGTLAIALLVFLCVPLSLVSSGSWHAPQNLSQHTNDILGIDIVVDSANRVHVVWSDGAQISHTYKTEAGWSEPQTIAYGTSPQLAADSQGHVYLAFSQRFTGEKDDIFVATWQVSSSWDPAVNISRTPTASLSPSIAVAPSDELAVSWSEESGDSFLIYLGRSPIGVMWSAAPVPNARGIKPAVAFDSATSLVVAWEDVFDEGFPMEIWTARYHDDAWTLPVDVSASPAHASTWPSLACGEGAVYLAWQESTPDGERAYTSHLTNGHWATATESSGDVTALMPRIAYSADRLHLVWTTENAVHHRTWDATLSLWAPIETVASDLIIPSVSAVSGNDMPHIVWVSEAASAVQDVWYTSQATPSITHYYFLPLQIRP